MWRVGTLENPDPDDLPEGAESVVIPVRDKQAGDEITYVLTDIAEQTRYTVAIVAVDPWGNRSETTVISFGTPANTPPALILESMEEVRVGYNRTETVRYHVSDPDSHGFTCELQDPSGAVAIRKEGDRLCLDIFNYKRIPGNYTAHVSVSDSFGASDTADFDFTLLPDQPPVATGGFRPVYLGSMQETAEFTPSQGFDDEVPGTVAYALEYDEEMLYLQPVASGYRIMPLRYGRSEVTVVATDEGGLAGRDTFAVMCRDDSREVDLYPNPVRDRLSIRMGRDVEGALRVALYDAAGRRAFAAEVRRRNLYDRTAIRRRFAHALHRQTLNPEKMQSFFRNILIAAALLAVPLAGTAQNAAAFLSVVPDARSAAMGGAGVALSADVFSALRNAAQLPFSEERFGAGYSYLPWMRDLTPRTALHTAAVYFKPDGKQAVSASFRYFSQYGSERTDEEGNVLGRLEPHDMAFDVGYSRTVAEGLSVALTARYVRSEPGTDDVAQTFAVDAGLFYRHAVAASHRVTFGFQAANVGGALDYGAGNRQLPWVLKAGAAAELGLSEAHGLTLTAETEYRLRPSELRAWSGSFGAEYRCFGILALRGGYRMGDRSTGEYRYGSAGAGFRWKYVAADAAYLLAGSSSPLRNTWILSVLFNW